MTGDPFGVLGLGSGASADDVRTARRRLAREHHPDRGGDPVTMRALNAAADEALRLLATPPEGPSGPPGAPDARAAADGDGEPLRFTTDVPSFTVEALPAETYEALVVVTSWLGDLLDDEPPYRLDVDLLDPLRCWCRLDLVPDAGATTVSITVGTVGDRPAPDIDVVRDVWVDALNGLDWDDQGPRPPPAAEDR